MKFKIISIILVILYSFNGSLLEKVEEEEREKVDLYHADTFSPIDDTFEISDVKFVPTNQWQKVGKNQAIPRGLHVRMNFETGEREAKLLDPELIEQLDQKMAINPNSDDGKNQKHMQNVNTNTNTKYSCEIMRKFDDRILDLPQKEQKVEYTVKSGDAQIIRNLIQNFNDSSNSEQKIETLNLIEDFAHQVMHLIYF
jgi:hypothetical protein